MTPLSQTGKFFVTDAKRLEREKPTKEWDEGKRAVRETDSGRIQMADNFSFNPIHDQWGHIRRVIGAGMISRIFDRVFRYN